MNFLKCIATNNKCYKANKNGKYNESPVTGIVVHSTGANNKTLKRYVQPSKDDPNREELLKLIGENKNGNSWNTDKDEKCVHAFIGTLADGSVATAKILPWSYACWGCANGKNGSYNYSPTRHIQFEVCEDNLKDEKYFNAAVKTEAVELCAYLCNLYDLSVDSIVSHKGAADAGYASNHGDIDHWLSKYGYTMKDFKKWVANAIKEQKGEDPEEEGEDPEIVNPYKVKVTACYLNIREGAGTDKKIVGGIEDGGVYTIVDEAAGIGASKWGKLKSGAGWISLDYCKRIEEKPFEPYKVRVKKDVCVIYAEANDKKQAGEITGGGVYTIVEEKSGFGKLKSGAGWIYLSDCEKVK